MQGLAGFAWWGSLLSLPGAEAAFARPEDELLRWLVPDLVLFGVGSLAVAWAAARRHAIFGTLQRALLWWIGLMDLWCLVVLATGGPGLGFVLMSVSWLGTLFAGRALFAEFGCRGFSAPLFHEMRGASGGRALWWTLAQVVVVWPVFLLLGPAVLVDCERILGVAAFEFRHQRVVGLALFVFASALNLWSGFAMARQGRGTPLPLACAPRLVCAGPYAFVRNPMAVFGLTQGLAVALWAGSWLTLAYVVMGGLVWDLVVRPVEEADLSARFGAGYEAYRREVRCWWPRLR